MSKLGKLISGLVGGSVIGITTALLLAPGSGEEIRKTIKERLDAAIEEARQAAAEQRAELEEELARLQGNR